MNIFSRGKQINETVKQTMQLKLLDCNDESSNAWKMQGTKVQSAPLSTGCHVGEKWYNMISWYEVVSLELDGCLENRCAMIYLTIDCHRLPLIGLNAPVYTGLNAQKLFISGLGRVGMGWKSLKAPLLWASLCSANNWGWMVTFGGKVIFLWKVITFVGLLSH